MDIKSLVYQALEISKSKIEKEALLALVAVEAGGRGFNPSTGKIMIQFEPHIFSKATKIPRSLENLYIWDENKVDIQPKEWEAFNDAFKINPNAAMESTSIGLPQIMGFHWKRLGFKSVGEMWDYFKVSELNQILMLIKFIETDLNLLKALIEKNWDRVASIYNGTGYKELAIKLGREPYDITLAKAYKRYKNA